MDKTQLLLLILRMLGQRAETAADLPRLNASRPYVQGLVARAHAAAIEITAATKAEHAERMASWRRGKPRPKVVQADHVAAVFVAESSARVEAPDGLHGEVGKGQVKPDGMARVVCPDLLDRLREPAVNALCTVRLLRYARDLCGGDFPHWITAYNTPKHCGADLPYSRRVTAILDAATSRKPVAVGDADARAITPTDVAVRTLVR
jgi:hypothetical protein